MPASTVKKSLIYIFIVSLFIADRLIKNFFIKNPGYKRDFLLLAFSLEKNRGIAFGIPIKEAILYPLVFFFIVILFVILFNLKNDNAKIIFFLILLAAISNFGDRILYQGVIDYIEIPHLLVFNIADIMITIGFIFSLFTYIVFKKSTFKIKQ